MTELVWVKWFDSAITDECRAFELEDAPVPHEMESAGLLVAETDTYVTIALDRSITNSLLRHAISIPKINILDIRRFPL